MVGHRDEELRRRIFSINRISPIVAEARMIFKKSDFGDRETAIPAMRAGF